jgi:type I restriction enzyme, S subunit
LSEPERTVGIEFKPPRLEPWLGALPGHWRLERAKWLFKKMERPVREHDEVVTCFRDGVVTLRRNRRVRGFTESLDGFGYQGIRRGDLVIHAMDAFAGAVGVSDSDGKGTGVYLVCEAQPHTEAGYYKHVLREMARSGWIIALAKGIRERSTDLRFATFGDQHLPVPPVDEQRLIARFLDYADWRIRRAVGAKQELIALLNEQKRAVIHSAVTRGLDPNVRRRPSGVAWLGDVPAHWHIAMLKSELWNLNARRVALSSTERGRMTDRIYDYYGASGVIDKVDDYLFDDELLLIAEDGANLVLRNLPLAVIARGKFWVNNHAHILKPRHGSLEYFAALLESMDFKPWISGAAQPKLTQERLMSIRVAVPPDSEQADIATWIKQETESGDRATEKARREIQLLREYRTRLVVDVVAGKLDVRRAAAQLPLAADEPDAFDDLVTAERVRVDLEIEELEAVEA